MGRIFLIKLIHSVIFLFLSGCVGFVLYSAVANQITLATWIAYGLMLAKGIVLMINGWRCPLTTYAEKMGSAKGSVTDIFLPKWLADRVFTICGSLFVVVTALLLVRLL